MINKWKQPTSDKQQLILNVAQKRFARFGLTKVTMEEIAQDLGMGKASLYYYFPTKDCIFRAVIAREQGKFIGLMQDLLAKELPASEKLRQYISKRLIYLRDFMNLNTLNLNSFYQIKPLFEDLFQEFAQQELEIFTAILRSGQMDGEFRVDDCPKTAGVLLNILRGLKFNFLKSFDGTQFKSEVYEELQQEMSLLMEIILNGIKQPTIPVLEIEKES